MHCRPTFALLGRCCVRGSGRKTRPWLSLSVSNGWSTSWAGFCQGDILFGQSFYGEDARSMGLVNRVVPASELLSHVQTFASAISANAPLTIKAAKMAINASVEDAESRRMAEIDLPSRRALPAPITSRAVAHLWKSAGRCSRASRAAVAAGLQLLTGMAHGRSHYRTLRRSDVGVSDPLDPDRLASVHFGNDLQLEARCLIRRRYVALGEPHLCSWNPLVGDVREQVFDDTEPRAPFFIGSRNEPKGPTTYPSP